MGIAGSVPALEGRHGEDDGPERDEHWSHPGVLPAPGVLAHTGEREERRDSPGPNVSLGRGFSQHSVLEEDSGVSRRQLLMGNLKKTRYIISNYLEKKHATFSRIKYCQIPDNKISSKQFYLWNKIHFLPDRK